MEPSWEAKNQNKEPMEPDEPHEPEGKQEQQEQQEPQETNEAKDKDKEKDEPGPEISRPFTPPPPYDPTHEELYDIEVSPAHGNYSDINEYTQEVNSFLRLLFRIGDSTRRAYSPLEYVSHDVVHEDIDGETVDIVKIKFGLSDYGSQNNITFEGAADNLASRVLQQDSDLVTGLLTVALKMGISPLSPIFKRSWTMAVYHSCAQLGLKFFTKFQAEFEARARPGVRVRRPKWAMVVHFLFLSEGKKFASILSLMTGLGVAPIHPWEENESDELTLANASNSAAEYVRGCVRDILSLSVDRRNEIFDRAVTNYRSQMGYISSELERQERRGFGGLGDSTTLGNFYTAVNLAVESASNIFASNKEMSEMFLSLKLAHTGRQGIALGTGGLSGWGAVNAINIARGPAALVVGVVNWPILAVGAVTFVGSAAGFIKANSDRKKAARAEAHHKKIGDKIRSSWNISWHVLTLLHILQYREQTLKDLQTVDHPVPAAREWWVTHVNKGVGAGFDIGLVNTFLSEQRKHLEKNRTQFETLMGDRH